MPKSPTQQELKDKFNQGVNDLKYKAFLAEAENAGKMGEFSPYDLALAQANPNAGMGILEAKKTGDNAAAQGIRTTQGGYYADSSGLGATPINAAGREFVKGVQSQQPNYSSVLTESYKSTSTPGQASGAFEYEPGPQRQPSYYEPNYRAVLEEARNYQPFNYNVESDPAYQAYAKAYRREGDRAAQNALAGAAGMTGGIPSSYAVGAATQAGSYYASQLSDKIPELYQQAYNRYLQEYSRRLGLADYYRQGMNDEESRYLSDVNCYNTDRNFAYGAYRDELADAERAETTEYNRTLAAQQYQDELAAAQAKAAYQRQQDDLDYGKWVAEFEADQSNKALANAIKIADALGYVPEQYAGILGVPAGTSTADAAYKAAKGTSAKGGGAGSGNSSGGEPFLFTADGTPLMTEDDAASYIANAFGTEIDPETWDSFIAVGLSDEWLKSKGFTMKEKKLGETPNEKANRFMGYAAAIADALSGGQDTTAGDGDPYAAILNSHSDSWVNIPGYGRVSYQELLKLVDDGTIIETESDGKYKYSLRR